MDSATTPGLNALANIATLGVILYLVVIFASIGSHVLFGVAAYNDARSKMNPNATMWGLLIGFLGLIPGIIYLCIRNNPVQAVVNCMKCGVNYYGGYSNCPRCGEPNPFSSQYMNPYSEQQKRLAKTLAIIATVLIVLMVLSVIVFIGAMFAMA